MRRPFLFFYISQKRSQKRSHDFRKYTNYIFWNKPQKRKMVSCINLQSSIPGKQIFSLVFNKSIRFLLNSVWKSYYLWWFNIKEGNKATKGFLQEHMFYVLQYDETEYMFNGGSCIDLLINYNFGLFIYEDKFLWNWFECHYHMIYTILKTKFERFEPKKLIYRNLKQFDCDQFHLDVYNIACLLWEPMQLLRIILFQF